MIRTILLNRQIPINKKVRNSISWYLKERGARKAWKNRHSTVLREHPGYKQKLDSADEKRHAERWNVFSSRISMNTIRICRHISGSPDERMVPEEIYQSDLEPSLNRYPEARFQCHKSFYNRNHPDGIFPADVLHAIDGIYYDSGLTEINFKKVKEIASDASYPLVLKPNGETRGGMDVHMINSAAQFTELASTMKHFVAQEKIIQHEATARYHPESLNTVRVDIYRSVRDQQVHILHAALRMGKHGSLDNLTSGGIVSYIKEGRLHGYALDKYGKKYETHPDTGVSFTGPVPDFESMKKVALRVARNVFLLRTFSLDLCYDSGGTWRAIEINPASSIRFAQYAGVPFFREFTDEVIEYCQKNHWAFF
jgi:hypothetical protein